jgi:hypothetical protein
MSRLNAGYQFCATYPQQFLVPASLTDEDVCASFSERSKGAFPAKCLSTFNTLLTVNLNILVIKGE